MWHVLAAPSGSPTNVTLSDTSTNSLTFTWERVACSDRGGANRYNYEIRNADGIFFSNTSALYAIIGGLLPCTNYTFRVRAFNNAGFSDFSFPIGATTGDVGKFDLTSRRTQI